MSATISKNSAQPIVPLVGFSTRERALAGAIARAFHNAAEEASEGPEAPSVPGSAT